MKRVVALLVCSACAAVGGASAATVEGRVFLDANGDGKGDAAEKGVSGVLVSDGLHVVTTEAAGTYRLETADGSALVWVCLPRGYAASGPFWRATQGGREVDFGLAPLPQADDFTFIQITDTHIGRDDLLKQFAAHIMQLPAEFAFAVNTGDLVGGVDVVTPDKAQAQYDRYCGAAAAFKIPLFNLPGNHEHVSSTLPKPDTTHPLYGKGLYRKVFGPTYYSWDWAGVHFVALDGTTLPYQERLGTNQLAWLAADLGYQPAGKPLVLFCHQSIPDLRDAKELAATLRGRHVLGAFCGHLHKTFTTAFAGFPVYLSGAMSGAWWSGPNIDGSPQGFRLVQIKGGALKTVFASREGATPMSVLSPSASALQSGAFTAEVAVVDFGKPVELAASYGGVPVKLEQASRDELWSVWKGCVDTGLAFDGGRILKIEAKQGAESSSFEIRYLVVNGQAEAYHADAAATLKVQVRGIDAADQVLLNGEPLGVVPPGTTNETIAAFTVAPEKLQRLNRVSFRAGPQGKGLDQFSVGPVWLEYKGKKIHDLRYASFERFTIVGDDPRRNSRELYECMP